MHGSVLIVYHIKFGFFGNEEHEKVKGIFARMEALETSDWICVHAYWTSTFFDIPHVTVDTIKIDWLHAADLGVITDFLGNFFWYLTMFKVSGGIRHGTHQQRCEEFFNTDIKGYYARERIEDRIPCLRPTMLKKDGGSSSEPKVGKPEA